MTTASFWIVMAVVWAVLGAIETATVNRHRRTYGPYPGMYRAAVYWFAVAFVAFIAGIALFAFPQRYLP